jgi:hypothetical protein
LSGQLFAAITIIAFLLIAALIGNILIQPLSIKFGTITHLVLNSTAGLCIILVISYILGSLGLLRKEIVFPILFLISIYSGIINYEKILSFLKNYPRQILKYSESLNQIHFSVIFISLVFFIILLVGAIGPEITYDSLLYHLTIAKHYSVSHNFLPIDQLPQSNWQLNSELLYSLVYSIAGEPAAKLLSFALGLLAVGTAYSLGKIIGKNFEAGLFSAAFFFTIPIVGWELTNTYVENHLALFLGCSSIVLMAWIQGNRSFFTVAIMGSFLGLSMGFKIFGAIFALGFAMVILWIHFQENGIKLTRNIVLTLMVLSVTTILLGSFWYVRSYINTGNPLFPFYNAVFKSPLFDQRNHNFNFGHYGIHNNLITKYILWPWFITFQSENYGSNGLHFGSGTGTIFLAFIGNVLLIKFRDRKFRVLLLITFLHLIFWTFQSQNIRYLIPSLLIFSGLFGGALSRFFKNENSQLINRISLGITLLLLACNVFFTLAMFYYQIPTRIPIEFALGFKSKQEYLQEVVPSYSTFMFLNQLVDSEDNVFVGGYPYQYLTNAKMHSKPWSQLAIQIDKSINSPALNEIIREGKIDYAIIPDWIIKEWKPYLDIRGFLIFAENNVSLYKLYSGESEVLPNCYYVEKVQNGDFEILDEKHTPKYWTLNGEPQLVIMDSNESNGFMRGNSILVIQENYFFQEISVTGGELYTFSADAINQNNQAALARLQVLWYDSANNQVGHGVDLIEIDSNEKRIQFQRTAPEAANYSQVYLIGHNAPLVFDNASFSERQCLFP